MSLINKPSLTNKDIARLLRSVAAAYLIKNENRFKIIAYENAADTVEHLTRELRDVWQEEKLDRIPGIGQSIASHLDEYFKKGYSLHFKKIFKDIPETVFTLMDVPTLGPKRAYRLVKKFKLTDPGLVLKKLKELCLAGRIAELPTFGKKSQEVILKALEILQKRSVKTDRMPLPYAFEQAKIITAYLKKHSAVKRADALGSLRRMVTTIGDIDMSVATKDKDASKIIKHFLEYPRKFSVDNAGEKKASIITTSQIRVDLRVQDEDSYGSMLQYFTGSKAHNILLREYALRKGLSLSEYGIKDLKHKKLLKFKDEESFYKFLGLEYIPPEIREGTNEIEMALKRKIPKLVELKDIKGDLHLHSDYDLKPSHDFGDNTYLEICEKAHQLNYEYVGFSDHNPKISDLSPLQITAIMRRRKEHIEKQLSRIKINYLIGLETDILPNGELALPQEAIEYIDYLIIAVHSVFRMETKPMTKRVLKALTYPKVKVLAHPTGRLLGRREGYELEWNKIFAEVKKRSIALEINAWPQRLDLPDSLVRMAIETGVNFAVNTDAHANYQMDNMLYGVSVARRGWAEKNDIINSKVYNEMKSWLELK